jgi:hypothetical protein
MTIVIRHIATVIGGLLLTFAGTLTLAPVVFAQRPPDPGGTSGGPASADQIPAQITVQHSSPTWVFVVVALAAIALTLVIQQFVVRVSPMLRQRVRSA